MNVRENAILDLQKQLARDLFREDVRNMGEFNECFNRGMDCKVLIVIDDVLQLLILSLFSPLDLQLSLSSSLGVCHNIASNLKNPFVPSINILNWKN